ncbi:EAL domain-containing protein [Fulvimarina sp. MAC3]|uniref:bifunctional diguanylate cyclase/phosphodiesterase n=1 Tax=Fulvimarina sp. MAC3 TaxID=3148887 RepID=UPI0031FC7FD2
METIVTCLTVGHDRTLLWAAAGICLIGVYASFSIATHAARAEGQAKRNWALLSIISAGCTAWATHMVALLAYRPGMPSAFEPVLMSISLLVGIAGIGLSMRLALGSRDRMMRVCSGAFLGLSITALHYLGQASYFVTGHVGWNSIFVIASIGFSIPIFVAAIVFAGERNRKLRGLAPVLLLIAIAVLHVTGMAAVELVYDPRLSLPALALDPAVVAPIVAAICMGLIVLAVMGLRFSLAAHARTRRDQKRLSELANLAVEGLAICDNGIITSANESLQRLTGWNREQLRSRQITSLLPTLELPSMTDQQEYDADLLCQNAVAIPVRVLCRDVKVGSKNQTVVAIRDQSERLKSEATIRRLAYTDALTGLTNRARFNDLLSRRMTPKLIADKPFALLALDLDRFKWVNDTMGHGIGDQLLCQIANRLRKCIQADDAVARLGGDEFMVLVDGNAEIAKKHAAAILESLTHPYTIKGQVIEIGSSIGIALSGNDGEGPEELCRSADLALYRAKNDGGGQFCCFEPIMHLEAVGRRQLEMDLRRALHNDEFEVHYQPQTNAASGAFEGAEALVRWRHPERGLVSPATFIPMAEDVGLIGVIGERVLQLACREAATWSGDLSIAVNLSAVQLADPKLVVLVERVLSETKLSAHRLELEVTETALLRDNARTYDNLRGLKALGVRISLDDFGTGYSSLSHLRRFAFDKIKIDQSFVRSIPSDQDSVAIVQAIVMLAGKLKMSVTIEGVEDAIQHQFAITEGCNQIQGYFISRPVPELEIRSLLASKGVQDRQNADERVLIAAKA